MGMTRPTRHTDRHLGCMAPQWASHRASPRVHCATLGVARVTSVGELAAGIRGRIERRGCLPARSIKPSRSLGGDRAAHAQQCVARHRAVE